MSENSYFSHEMLFPGVYRCVEKYFSPALRANIYVVQGRDLDVVVDAGTGVWNVRKYLEQNNLIGAKPCLAVATHIHYDHTGGMHQFQDVAIHEAEAEYLQRGDNSACLTIVQRGTITHAPHGFSERKYKVRKVENIARVLGHGDEIYLGGDVILHVLHAPGHSEGSIMLFDRRRGYLFSGDVMYAGTLLDFLPNSNIRAYRKTMTDILELADTVTYVFPGHFDGFERAEMQEIAVNYLRRSERLMHRFRGLCLRCLILAYIGGRSDSCRRKTCHYSWCCCFMRCICE